MEEKQANEKELADAKQKLLLKEQEIKKVRQVVCLVSVGRTILSIVTVMMGEWVYCNL